MDSSYLVCLPFVLKEYADECLATCKFGPENMLVIDNTVNNLGIMKSHNLGVRQVIAEKRDWLVVLSAAIRFGSEGGLDFIRQLDRHRDYHVLEAAGVFGWHLIAFSRKTLEEVGEWDENFTPYGFDDLDYSQRIQMTYREKMLWSKAPVDATDEGMGHSIKKANVHAPADIRLAYYCKKWGVTLAPDGGKSEPTYQRPFNDETKSLAWWPTPPDPRSIMESL